MKLRYRKVVRRPSPRKAVREEVIRLMGLGLEDREVRQRTGCSPSMIARVKERQEHLFRPLPAPRRCPECGHLVITDPCRACHPNGRMQAQPSLEESAR